MSRRTDGVLCELVFTVSFVSPFASCVWGWHAMLLGTRASVEGLEQAVFCTT